MDKNRNHEIVMSPKRDKLFRSCKSPVKKIVSPSKTIHSKTVLSPRKNNIKREFSPRKTGRSPKKTVSKKHSEKVEGESTDTVKRASSSKLEGKELAADLKAAFPLIKSNFEITKKVGEGTFSKVYLARLRQDRSIMFALKHLVPTSSPGRIENELKCLQLLGGKNNILSVKTAVRNGDHIVFVLPYFQHQKFSEIVREMTVGEMKDYMWNLLLALKHVHTENIIHRDVKPSNFLFSKERRRYSLIDFGLAMPVPGCKNSILQDYTSASSTKSENLVHKKNAPLGDKVYNKCRHIPSHICSVCKGRARQTAPRAGTPGFRSPEVLMRYPNQTTAVDMWSAGVILLSMLSRRYPFFKARDDREALAQIVTLVGTKKMKRFAENIGKRFVCSPAIEDMDSYKELCVKLAQRQCKKHSITDICSQENLMRKGKRKRADSPQNSKRPTNNSFANMFADENKQEQHDINNTIECSECTCVPDCAYNLLERLLEVDPNKRITAEEALKHPFILGD